jgi:hypothetical protein
MIKMTAMLTLLRRAYFASSWQEVPNPQLTRRSRPVGGAFMRSIRGASHSTSSFESDGQPIEGSNLSGSFVASPDSGESEQLPNQIRIVTRGLAGEADRMEQQARISFTLQNACALCIPDKLVPRRHIAAPQFVGGKSGRISGRGGRESTATV